MNSEGNLRLEPNGSLMVLSLGSNLKHPVLPYVPPNITQQEYRYKTTTETYKSTTKRHKRNY